MTILRFADLRPDRWRNDGGTTREIASCGDDPTHVMWRLSLAEVEHPGPFSLFPDAERILTVVDGEEMVLDVEGQEHTVERGRPFHFSGDAAVTARLPTGSVRALNVVIHRGTLRADVAIQELSAQHSHHVSAGSYAVVVSGRAVVQADGVLTELFRFDTVQGDELESPEVTGHGLLAVVSFTDRGRSMDMEPSAGTSI